MSTEWNKWEKTYTSNHHKFYKYRKNDGTLIKIEWHFCGGYKVYIYKWEGELVKEQYVHGTLSEIKKIALEMESKL